MAYGGPLVEGVSFIDDAMLLHLARLPRNAGKDNFEGGDGEERPGLYSPRVSRGDDRSGTGGAGSHSYHSGGRSAEAAGELASERAPCVNRVAMLSPVVLQTRGCNAAPLVCVSLPPLRS